jgi:hypothetical protein
MSPTLQEPTMDILAITDIPRMTELFERLGQQQSGLTVASEIHRGIEELENHKPSVVIIQNYLAGLSADILHKHLKSRLGGRKVRFALISSSAALDVDVSSQFEVILDPALPDEQLEESVLSLLKPVGKQKRRDGPVAATVAPAPREQEPILPGLLPRLTKTEPVAPQPHLSPGSALDTFDDGDGQHSPPITYQLPRRPGLSIISDFSQQLDSKTDDTNQRSEPFSYREQELGLKDFHRDPHLITDFEEPRPWYRRTGVLLAATTLIVVVGVSLFQHRASITVVEQKPATNTKAPLTAPVTPAPVVPPAPAAVGVPAVPPAPAATAIPQLVSHGVGRPRNLPGFIPKEGHDPAYAKEHPGWNHYRGQTAEYRVFREKDATIKAIQVLDRSGAGLQESFYISTLKELAGVTTMRPTSSEIKEGYEIRRGEVAGLQLVQYRDAQGGRMRGFVVTWP